MNHHILVCPPLCAQLGPRKREDVLNMIDFKGTIITVDLDRGLVDCASGLEHVIIVSALYQQNLVWRACISACGNNLRSNIDLYTWHYLTLYLIFSYIFSLDVIPRPIPDIFTQFMRSVAVKFHEDLAVNSSDPSWPGRRCAEPWQPWIWFSTYGFPCIFIGKPYGKYGKYGISINIHGKYGKYGI